MPVLVWVKGFGKLTTPRDLTAARGLHQRRLLQRDRRVHGVCPRPPGDVFKLSVTVPSYADLARNNPDLKNFTFPAQSAIQLTMGTRLGGLTSQNCVYINIK